MRKRLCLRHLLFLTNTAYPNEAGHPCEIVRSEEALFDAVKARLDNPSMAAALVWRCRLMVSEPKLKACMVSALEI